MAREIKSDYVEWMDAIGRKQKNAVRWWASPLASRSPMQSDCFVLTCYGELLHGWLKKGSAPVDVVVVADPFLWWMLKGQCAGCAAVRFEGSVWRVAAAAAQQLGRVPRIFVYIWWWTLSVIIGARPWRAVTGDPSVASSTLLYTWIEPRTFTADHHIRDTYLGGLAELLDRQGQRFTRLTPLVFARGLMAQVAADHPRFICTPAFLRIRDLGAVLKPFWISARRECGLFRGRDHQPLLIREVLRTWALPWFAHNMLWHCAIRRVAARCHGVVKTVIYPYENQPWEKLLILAFRESAPGARLVGYQTAGIPDLLLGFFLAPGEFSRAPFPDMVVTNGEGSRSLFERSNYPIASLAVGGAFRFEHVQPVTARRIPRSGPPRIAVALPIAPQSAAVAVRELVACFREPMFVAGYSQPLELQMLAHPLLPIDRLADSRAWPPWIHSDARGIGQALPDIGLCLFVAPTGAWREALFAGVPVVKYLPDCLDLDSIDTLGSVVLPTCIADTVRGAIAQHWNKPADIDAETLLRHVFAPVDEAVWLRVVRGVA